MTNQIDILLENVQPVCPVQGKLNSNAIGISNGQIQRIGDGQDIRKAFSVRKSIDLAGGFLYPGFIDSHGHPYWHGLMLKEIHLNDCQNMQEVARKLFQNAKPQSNGWLTGLGWNDALWPENTKPGIEWLDHFFPAIPVLIKRVDFHAALANTVALKKAGIYEAEKNKDIPGLLKENEIEKVENQIPELSWQEKADAIQRCAEDCFSHGITSVADAAATTNELELIEHLQEITPLEIYPVALVEPGRNATFPGKVKALKYFGDGALGSEGAKLQEPYQNKPGHTGSLVWNDEELFESWKLAAKQNYQVWIHAIGDETFSRAVKLMNKLSSYPQNLRWRIEHCQITDSESRKLFGMTGAIPSMQPLQAVSDAGWAEKKIGKRVANSYCFRSLLRQSGKIALNSDFPIETPSVLQGFAAVTSGKTPKGLRCIPEGETLTPEEALAGYTSWNAYAQFEENQKGQLKEGFAADLTVIDSDLLKDEPNKVREGSVLATFKSGRRVF